MLGQTSNKSSGPPPPDQALTPGFPIDNNIFILIAMGLIFGMYVAYKKHKANNAPA